MKAFLPTWQHVAEFPYLQLVDPLDHQWHHHHHYMRSSDYTHLTIGVQWARGLIIIIIIITVFYFLLSVFVLLYLSHCILFTFCFDALYFELLALLYMWSFFFHCSRLCWIPQFLRKIRESITRMKFVTRKDLYCYIFFRRVPILPVFTLPCIYLFNYIFYVDYCVH